MSRAGISDGLDIPIDGPNPRASVLIESKPTVQSFVLTYFVYANRYPPPASLRGRLPFENAVGRDATTDMVIFVDCPRKSFSDDRIMADRSAYC